MRSDSALRALPSPARGRSDVCPDSPLLVPGTDFSLPREIRVLTADGAVVARVEPDADGQAVRTVGDATDDRGLLHEFSYSAVRLIDAFQPHYEIRLPVELPTDTQCRVVIDGRDRGWTFRTRPRLPADIRRFRVDASGDGDFCTVQGAIDAARRAARPSSGEPFLIEIAAGNYAEICYLTEECPPLILRGAGRGRTVIGYDNNNLRNGQPSASRCLRRLLGDRDLYNGWRACLSIDATDITIEDLTLINTTPAGGSQAEALRGNHDRLLLNRVELRGHQDTVRVQRQALLSHCLISGEVDFVWGGGTVVHWRSEFVSTGPGYVFQTRNDAEHRGHLALDCDFSATPDVPVGSVYVARTDTRAFPHSELILAGCTLGRHLHPDRFRITPDGDASTVRFDCCDRSRVDPQSFLGGWLPYTVNIQQPTVVAGTPMSIDWSAPDDHAGQDRIVVDDQQIAVDDRGCLGRLELTAPTRPGSYSLRYQVRGPDGRYTTRAHAPLEVIPS